MTPILYYSYHTKPTERGFFVSAQTKIVVELVRSGGKLFFPQNGGWASQKGAITPLSRKKGVPAKKIIPKCTDPVFLRYQFGKYQEIPTKYRPKIPNRYTTLIKMVSFC
jgi:hypothetical protein